MYDIEIQDRILSLLPNKPESIYKVNGKLVVRYSGLPNEETIILLKELGFSYNTRKQEWILNHLTLDQNIILSFFTQGGASPKPSDFDLSEHDLNQIIDFNLLIQTERKKYYKNGLIITILIIIIIVLSTDLDIFTISFYSVLLYFTYLYLIKKILTDHVKTSNLNNFNIMKVRHNIFLEYGKQAYWKNMDGFQFEQELGKLLKPFFTNVIVTKGTGDGGVDIVVKDKNATIIIQCKNHKKPVGPEPIRALIGVMAKFNAKQVVMVSMNGYSKGVYEELHGKNYLYLYDINDILNWYETAKHGYINFTDNKYLIKK